MLRIDGKARLIKDDYCDGLETVCLHVLWMQLKIIEREANEYDEAAVKARIAAKKWLRMQKRTVHLFMSVRAAWQEVYSMHRRKML